MTGTKSVYYWDTCLFLAWLKDEQTRKPGEMDAVSDMLERFKKREISLMTSVLTITEMSVAKVPVGTYALLEDVMQRPNFTKIAVDIRVARLAKELRDHYLQKSQIYGGKTLTVPDAIHVASAILFRAAEMHTFDENNNSKQNSLGLLPLSGDVGGHQLVICKPPIPVQMKMNYSS